MNSFVLFKDKENIYLIEESSLDWAEIDVSFEGDILFL
jgi:hypothetical protein